MRIDYWKSYWKSQKKNMRFCFETKLKFSLGLKRNEDNLTWNCKIKKSRLINPIKNWTSRWFISNSNCKKNSSELNNWEAYFEISKENNAKNVQNTEKRYRKWEQMKWLLKTQAEQENSLQLLKNFEKWERRKVSNEFWKKNHVRSSDISLTGKTNAIWALESPWEEQNPWRCRTSKSTFWNHLFLKFLNLNSLVVPFSWLVPSSSFSWFSSELSSSLFLS